MSLTFERLNFGLTGICLFQLRPVSMPPKKGAKKGKKQDDDANWSAV